MENTDNQLNLEGKESQPITQQNASAQEKNIINSKENQEAILEDKVTPEETIINGKKVFYTDGQGNFVINLIKEIESDGKKIVQRIYENR